MTSSPGYKRINNDNASYTRTTAPKVEIEEYQDWQSKMLKRLIDSATPEPIKVACTVSPPGLPEYLGEEYHGRISKEEEKRLLDGKSGRYLVRDSFTVSRLHEYTLAFNHDHEIQHVKLIYNPLYKSFKTDSSGKDFKSILELMSDVLELFRDIKRRQPSVTINKKERYSKPHVFKTHSYKHPKWCDECGNFLWGLFSQGYKCEDCGLNVHKNCKELAPLPCMKVVFGRKASKITDDRLNKKRGSIPSENTNGRESPPNNYIVISKNDPPIEQCTYYKQCSRFLSAFKIRDTFVDMSHNMTRCFCEKCIQKTSNNVTCSNLKQWTRFHFEQQEDRLKRNINEWEVVYFAIKPQLIEDVLKKCFNPPSEDNDLNDLVVAPSLAYTVQDMINENWSYKFTDTRTADELYAQTVLEVYVRPNSYEVMVMPSNDIHQSHECGAPLVPENWKVKKLSDVYPKSILVKIFSHDLL